MGNGCLGVSFFRRWPFLRLPLTTARLLGRSDGPTLEGSRGQARACCTSRALAQSLSQQASVCLRERERDREREREGYAVQAEARGRRCLRRIPLRPREVASRTRSLECHAPLRCDVLPLLACHCGASDSTGWRSEPAEGAGRGGSILRMQPSTAEPLVCAAFQSRSSRPCLVSHLDRSTPWSFFLSCAALQQLSPKTFRLKCGHAVSQAYGAFDRLLSGAAAIAYRRECAAFLELTHFTSEPSPCLTLFFLTWREKRTATSHWKQDGQKEPPKGPKIPQERFQDGRKLHFRLGHLQTNERLPTKYFATKSRFA